MASMALVAALYPSDHPYHWLTIGSAEDLKAADIADVRAFFQTYYHPANASIAVAGDIDPDVALELVEKYFGEISRGPAVPRVTVLPRATTPSRPLLLEDRVELPRLYLAWRTPALFAGGDAELDLVADVLTHGKTSRLYRALVYDTRVATEVTASQNSRELESFFQIVATAAPGRTLGELERAISDEIERLASGGAAPPEMERAQAQSEAQFVHRLQTVGGFSGKADQLNAYNTFLGDPGGFALDLARYRSVTAATLGEAAAAYLGRASRVALSVVPLGAGALALEDSVSVQVS
jgi:zinc protease